MIASRAALFMPATTYSPAQCGAGAPARETLPLSQSGPLARNFPWNVRSSQTTSCHSGYAAGSGGRGRPPHTFIPIMPGLAFSKYRYRRRLPHLQKDDAPVFVTFCSGARAELPFAVRSLVLDHCLREHRQRVELHAVVIMPDHVHLLFEPLRDAEGWAYPMVDILQCLKGATAHRINKLLGRSGPVWQEESFDHILRNSESLKEKVEYIRQNPVRRGIVSRSEDYRWLWVNPALDL
jgi:putative transposase